MLLTFYSFNEENVLWLLCISSKTLKYHRTEVRQKRLLLHKLPAYAGYCFLYMNIHVTRIHYWEQRFLSGCFALLSIFYGIFLDPLNTVRVDEYTINMNMLTVCELQGSPGRFSKINQTGIIC